MPKRDSWLAAQVVYEIFPERFAVGSKFDTAEKLALPCYHRANDYVTRSWDTAPAGCLKNNALFGDKSFFGGDLYGVIDHLDYLQELGVTTVFLTPVFFAPSSHKYDTTDFFEVDEQFGGDKALEELVDQLRRRGMHLFLDIAFNHVSDIHPWFIAALRNEPPFRDFFLRSSDFLEDEFRGVGSPDFFLGEFRHHLSLSKLCAVLEADLGISLPPLARRVDWPKIDWLNGLLPRRDIHQQLLARAKHTPDYSANATGESRPADPLPWWNRSLLEALYPKETPQIRNRFTPKNLCQAIIADCSNLQITSAPETVAWLNEAISKPELPDCIAKKDHDHLGSYEKDTISRLRKEYGDSRGEDQLKALNRYLLEAFYPDQTPMGYQSWRGFRLMPELNLTDKNLQAILFRDHDSVLQRYLRMGVDGFRFDSANDLGSGVIQEIRDALRDSFPEAVFIGEVTNYGGGWINEHTAYDGVMNYYFYGLIDAWLRGDVSARQLNWSVDEYCTGYGKKGSIRSWNILSSHDTPRLKSGLAEQSLRQLAVIAQFTLPGVPFIYYGEEIGMEGGEAPDCRRPMVWDEARWDVATGELYRKLIGIRRSHPELQQGGLLMLGHKMTAECLAFLRFTERINQVSIIVLNGGDSVITEKLFIPYSHLYDGLRLRDALHPALTCVVQRGGHIDLEVAARSAVILSPDDSSYPDYRFYKPRNLSA